jgi:hypothetical protein
LFLLFALFGTIAFAVLDRGQVSQTVELVMLSIFFAGPLAVNSVLLIKHQLAAGG